VIAAPPLFEGELKLTDALAFPAVAPIPLGAPGAVVAAVGVTAFDTADPAPVPALLVAATVKV
jgi:hypothetical protein